MQFTFAEQGNIIGMMSVIIEQQDPQGPGGA